MDSGVTITVEHGLHLHTPEGEAVLAGLGAFNASKLPAPKNRFGVTAHDAATGDLLGGVSIVTDGTTGYSFWGAWTAPDADIARVVGALLTRAAAELAARGGSVLEMHARAHAPLEPYRAAGFEVVQRIAGHVLGADYVVLRRAVGPEDRVTTGPLPVAVWEPLPKSLAQALWRGVDAYRQRHIPAPFRWASSIVRHDGQVKGGALCYAAGGDFMVDMVWLDEALRGRHVGMDMLKMALEAGRAMGCTRAGVETMDCQAPDYYRKAGFEPMGYLATDVPGMGFNFYQMRL